ncbi:hypothetical protein AB1N83_010207 [Pleurotus pulmonarius]
MASEVGHHLTLRKQKRRGNRYPTPKLQYQLSSRHALRAHPRPGISPPALDSRPTADSAAPSFAKFAAPERLGSLLGDLATRCYAQRQLSPNHLSPKLQHSTFNVQRRAVCRVPMRKDINLAAGTPAAGTLPSCASDQPTNQPTNRTTVPYCPIALLPYCSIALADLLLIYSYHGRCIAENVSLRALASDPQILRALPPRRAAPSAPSAQCHLLRQFDRVHAVTRLTRLIRLIRRRDPGRVRGARCEEVDDHRHLGFLRAIRGSRRAHSRGVRLFDGATDSVPPDLQIAAYIARR